MIEIDTKIDLMNLITSDPVLEDLIITDYPGILKEKQHIVLKEEGIKVYVFLDLEKDKVDELLRNYERSCYLQAHRN